MSATNPNALQDVIGKLYVAPKVSLWVDLDDDMTNSESVRTALNALTYTRMASITDLTMSINLQDKLVEVESDDNGILKSFSLPTINITGNWFETGDVDALEVLLGIQSLAVAGSPNSVNYGFNLATRVIPELVVKIVTDADENGNVKTAYLYNAGLSADLQFTFLDIVRAGDLPASPFELAGKKGGFVLINDQRIV